MDENNQILDVTYGSFSCRLEGFDDSVETMKLVVSYFHELAGHDRFMDMALQAPDMETLARLTEEQTGQSVDIDMDDGQLRMRAHDDVEDETFDEDVAAEIDPATDTPAQEPDVADETYASDLQSNVADKLQRLRAVAATGMASSRIHEPQDLAEDLNKPAAAAPSASPLSQRLSDLVKRNVDAQAAQTPEVEQAIETDVDVDVDVDVEQAHEAEEEQVPVAEEDLTSNQEEAADQEPMLQAESPIASEVEEDDLNVFSDTDTEMSTEGDIPDDDFAAVDENITVAEDETEDTVEATDLVAALDDEVYDEDLEPAGEASEFMSDAEVDFPETADDVIAEEDATETEDEFEAASNADSTDTAEDDAAPLVLADDDAVAEVDEDTVAQDDEDHDDYNDDDEFDLEEEVAKVEAEIAARKGDDIARHGLPRHVEDAMSRIMSQTDQHLNQPENRRHRDAFAQLKAAVAATEAARQLGDRGADQRDPDEAYKDDLGAHAATDKGGAKSTPPLKLVKSQEVKPAVTRSATAAPSSTPLDTYSDRLRKIATLKDAEPVEDKAGFADFASEHGATELVDRLEAAGAYICLVEGEADFSRPQVMKVVQSATSEEISREDGLRSFGRLLRQARLIKLENGRFQIAENTQYRPQGGRAAQG